MSDPHLILHKVRGEPVFDVAVQLDDSDIWIIPTSGHRAYPFEAWPMNELGIALNNFKWVPVADVAQHPGWADWPDHYSAATKPLTTSRKHVLTEEDLKEILEGL